MFKGSEVLDYGTSGSGLIARTTLDAMGSPYEQIATWVNDPSNGNNYTVQTYYRFTSVARIDLLVH